MQNPEIDFTPVSNYYETSYWFDGMQPSKIDEFSTTPAFHDFSIPKDAPWDAPEGYVWIRSFCGSYWAIHKVWSWDGGYTAKRTKGGNWIVWRNYFEIGFEAAYFAEIGGNVLRFASEQEVEWAMSWEQPQTMAIHSPSGLVDMG